MTFFKKGKKDKLNRLYRRTVDAYKGYVKASEKATKAHEAFLLELMDGKDYLILGWGNDDCVAVNYMTKECIAGELRYINGKGLHVLLKAPGNIIDVHRPNDTEMEYLYLPFGDLFYDAQNAILEKAVSKYCDEVPTNERQKD